MPGRSRKGITLLFCVALLIAVADRVAKHAVLTAMSAGQSIPIIPHVFHLTLVLNKGAAFGLFKGGRIFFIVSFLCAALSILYYASDRRTIADTGLAVGLALVLGGAIGNAVDRMRYGHVIDFIDFRVWPVFNIADSAITIGVLLLILRFLSKRHGGRSCIPS